MCYSAVRELEGGQEVDRISSWLMPNIMSVPDIRFKAGYLDISWVVPVDDSHYIRPSPSSELADSLRRLRPAQQRQDLGRDQRGGAARRVPGDFEAQSGQGPISLHSEDTS